MQNAFRLPGIGPTSGAPSIVYVIGPLMMVWMPASASAGMRSNTFSSTGMTRSTSSGHRALTKLGSMPSMPQVRQSCS